VSNKPGHRGEREVSRKTIARGMPGRSGVTVVTTLVCFFISHARLRAHRAPGIPCALYFRRGETILQNSGTARREIADAYVGLDGNAVIPGRCEASNPESRDSPMCNCTSEVG
jgi:hypothetical protein